MGDGGRNLVGMLVVGHDVVCCDRSRIWGMILRGGRVKVCWIEGEACEFQCALFCWFAMLNGGPWSLLYSLERRVGCHVEGDAVCRGLLQTDIHRCMMNGFCKGLLQT